MENNKKRVLIACSGGPDSMALLDMCSDRYECVAAHVNYHKRDTADRDERIVREYCKKRGIPFRKKDYRDTGKGNFQDNARVFRYEFFAELVREMDLDCVMVAHHRDDLLETYLLQKKRGGDVTCYGLSPAVTIKGVKVKRPLLRYTKEDLLEYCLCRGIRYGIDESNLGDDYARNRIRHGKLERMTEKEKKELLKEIRDLNRQKKSDLEKAKRFLAGRKKIGLDEYLAYEDTDLLFRLLTGLDMSGRETRELNRQIKEGKDFEILLKDRYLVKEYGYLEVYPKEDDYEFSYERPGCHRERHFALKKKGASREGAFL